MGCNAKKEEESVHWGGKKTAAHEASQAGNGAGAAGAGSEREQGVVRSAGCVLDIRLHSLRSSAL